MQLDGYYINLDSAVKRREDLEKHLAEIGFSERITTQRFPAIVPSPQETQHFLDHLPAFLPGHMGCFLSHKALVQHKITNNDGKSDLLVVEDDTKFSPRTEFFLAEVFGGMQDGEWDLLYADYIINTQEEKVAFYEVRRQCGNDRVIYFDLKNYSFSGTSCYIVNRKSLEKYKAALDELNPVNKLIDWHIQDQVHAGKLIALGIFPFLSTVSREADFSSIDGGIPLSHFNNFIRRHFWIDAMNC